MNKRPIQSIDQRMRTLIIRIARDSKELNDLRVERRKLVTGKLKHPPPAGIKHTINEGYTKTRDFDLADYDDVIPSFGPGGQS
jgi:hypothetical protein